MTLKEICENHGLTPEGVNYALEQYQKVICEITHGLLSKLTYDADDILRLAQERWCETCDLKEENEWVSVDDRTPDTPLRCIGYAKDPEGFCGQMFAVWFAPFMGWWHGSVKLKDDFITHWMPLPKPPVPVKERWVEF